jgi:methyl-accepting chemotaxis protein
MDKTYQNRRRNYYIDKEYQSKFIVKFCLLVILGMIISGALLFLMSQGTVTTVFENSRLKIKSTADFILPSILASSVVVIILVGLATIIVTLYASHKIAGPLYRVAMDLKKVTAGDLTVKFSLREHDQLQALAENIDDTVKRMCDDVGDLKDKFRGLETALDEARKSSDSAKLREAADLLRDITGKLSKFKT